MSVVAAIDPQLTVLPEIEANGMMRMAGFFPSVPAQINFEMLFAPVDGQWRLFGLSVARGQAAPAAPQTPPEAAVRPLTSRPPANGAPKPRPAASATAAPKPAPAPPKPEP